MGMEKEYTGTFTIGAITPTYDLESEPIQQRPFEHITSADIDRAVQQLTGPILQVPPQHSAIKKDGKPVYLAARKGKEIQLEPRPVTIYTFEITSVELPVLHFRVVCSTGTYIRSLANDIGQILGTGAYLSSLRRTRIGEFKAEDALSPEQFQQQIADLAAASEGQPNSQL